MRDLAYVKDPSRRLQSSDVVGYRTVGLSCATNTTTSLASGTLGPKGTGTLPSNGRRRSHRPRGCRGGRKNRKNQLAKATALLPKEILDSPVPLCPTNMSSTSQQAKKLDDSQPHIRSAEKGYLGLPFMNRSKVGAAFSGTHSVSQEKFPSSSFYQKRIKADESQQRLRLLKAGDVAAPNMYRKSTATTGTGKWAVNQNNSTEILPPLPPCAQTKHEESPDPSLLQGPNPYALNNTSSGGFIEEPDITKMQPGPSAKKSTVEEYRNQRISKQLQAIANGGSLFVTSPRSFLLGGPKSASPKTAW